jgi:hypothetical protein
MAESSQQQDILFIWSLLLFNNLNSILHHLNSMPPIMRVIKVLGAFFGKLDYLLDLLLGKFRTLNNVGHFFWEWTSKCLQTKNIFGPK